MTEKEENTWLLGISKKDDIAYSILFREYFYSLSSFVHKYIGNVEDSEDIVQNVFFTLWEKNIYFESVMALRLYMYKTARTKVWDYLKHRKIEQKYILDQRTSEDDFLFYNVLEEETFRLLETAIDKLPDVTCQIYKLLLKGMSNEDICQEMGLTMDSVKSHKKRGKSLLKSLINNKVVFNILTII